MPRRCDAGSLPARSAIREQRDYLTQLDAAIGDADHGANMDRGFAAVVERLDGDGAVGPPGAAAHAPAPRSSPPSAGRAARSGARRCGGPGARSARPRSSAPTELADALDAALGGVVELGAASEGDKTMVDALAPAVRALRERVEGGAGLAEALAAAREAGEEGMRATVPLQALEGRASYLGERSIGHQDPGATSTALIIAALERAAAAEA